jgi:alkanesulfonate monooxygenase SsuD/methylene tetrahydromethanopterin reductase-like flavin-dependent oxidoreductase (luciferase family)
MPTNSGTPYERILESITTLGYLAGITSKARLGVSSLIMAMRNPVIAVKQLVTIDNLSSGRLILATSAGWNESEFRHLGSNFRNRGRRLDENIRLLRTLWDGGMVKFEGKRSDIAFEHAVFEPHPVQKKLTVWIAGNSKAAMTRAINFGDAWHPNVYPISEFRKLVAEFRHLPGGEGKPICVRIGLNMKSKTREYTGPQGEKRLILTGDMAENKRTISELAEVGAEYFLVSTSPDGKVPIQDQLNGVKKFKHDVIKNL